MPNTMFYSCLKCLCLYAAENFVHNFLPLRALTKPEMRGKRMGNCDLERAGLFENEGIGQYNSSASRV